MSVKKQTIYKCDICGEEIVIETNDINKDKNIDSKNPLTELTLPCIGGENRDYVSTTDVGVCKKCLCSLSDVLRKSGYYIYNYYGLTVELDKNKMK